MSDGRQAEIPTMKPVETAYLLTAPYDSGLVMIDLNTSEWQHVCACRFGEARDSSVGCKWSGDSYRYDIFVKGEGHCSRIALRWWNGAGEGWLTDEMHDRRNEVHLLDMISKIPDEARRWDFCHKLWETQNRTMMAAKYSEASRIFKAFCDGKLKKRKRNGMYSMEIQQ